MAIMSIDDLRSLYWIQLERSKSVIAMMKPDDERESVPTTLGRAAFQPTAQLVVENPHQALIERCIAFLQTDLEYEGALLRHRQPLSHLVKRLLRGSEEQTTIFSPQTEEASSFITPW